MGLEVVLQDLVVSSLELVELDDAVSVEVELLEELVNTVTFGVDGLLDLLALGDVLDGVLDQVINQKVELVEIKKVVLVVVIVGPEILKLLIGKDDDSILLVGLSDLS